MPKADGRRRVVVTGVGLVTPVGVGVEEAWAAARAGVSGADEVTLVDHRDFSVHFACEVKDFDATRWMDAHEARRVDRFVHFALAATRQAMEMSRLDIAGRVPAERCGVVFGSGVGGIRSMEEQYQRYVDKGPRRISPLTIPYLMVNCAPGMIAITHGFKGVNYAPVSACSTANHAIGLALRHIQWGEADVVLTGGAEAGISVLGLGGFSNMKALSTRNDDPKTASRPFDKDRDGFVIAEGAGALVLEEYEFAKARGATILAELLGYGFTDDAFHITAPDETGDGGTRAMRLAVADAGLRPEQIDYINAHGTSTAYNDKTETLAIKQAFGDHARKLAASSTKGQTGHGLGAAAAFEGVFTTLAVRDQVMPPTINQFTPDPDCDLDYVPNVERKARVDYALSNALGFGGHNATVCFGRCE